VTDAPLLDALGFPRPNPVFRALVRGGLKARGRTVRWPPPRRPYFVRQLPQIRNYPGGYDVAALGTFPGSCPLPRLREPEPEDAGTPV
jgi:hypothetical protein